MQTDLTHCEDAAELEDDILCFLPAVSKLDVFGCELELLNLQNQQLLPEAFRTVLLQRPQLQIVVRSCMVDGHSIWQFQDGKESYPKTVRVPSNSRGAVPDRAFHAAPSFRHVEVTTGTRHVGAAAWQACQQPQIVKLPPSVISLAEGAFLGCYVLREVIAPGCVRRSQGVCRVLLPNSCWASHGTEDNSVLAPGTQPGKCVFESCLTLPPSPLTWIKLVNLEDCLKGRSVMHALNSSACRVTSTISGRVPVKIVKALVELNLMDTEITALPSSTFAHCVALNSIWLPPRLTLMGKEATVHFVGVNKVQCFTPLDWSDIEQWMQSEHNAFFMCDKFEKPQWVELLSAEGPDSDAFDEELNHEYCQNHVSPCGLQESALASTVSKGEQLTSQPQTPLAQTIIANSLSHMEFDDSSMIGTPPEKEPVMEYSL